MFFAEVNMVEKRQVFFSFYYARDAWRASQVRNIGTITNDEPLSDNDWEEVKKGGDAAIKKWIDDQLQMRSCTVVLIGQETASRPWIDYEIQKSWELGKGIVGICIHNLKDRDGTQAPKGENPFAKFKVDGKPLMDIIETHCEEVWADSKDVYAAIQDNIAQWVEQAIEIRNGQPENSKIVNVSKLNNLGAKLGNALKNGALGVSGAGTITTVTPGTGHATAFYGTVE